MNHETCAIVFVVYTFLIMMDLGGIQEKAPGLGKPALILRDITEQPEGIGAGTVRLVGTETYGIIEQTRRLLNDAEECQKVAWAVNPYGNGRTAQPILVALLEWGRQGAD